MNVTKRGVYFTDPGDITPDEILNQMTNPDRVPIWQMHPCVQHAIRMCDLQLPSIIQRYDTDRCRWVRDHTRGAQIFMEIYRVRRISLKFSLKFLNEVTCISSWPTRHRK